MSDEWGSDALNATKLKLVRGSVVSTPGSIEEAEFNPIFVYPIFGEEETIFGYKDLEIQLQFSSGNLNQFLNISYKSKFPENPTVKADDPELILYEFIPPNYSKSQTEFAKIVEKDELEFKPIGTKVGAYQKKSQPIDLNGKGKGKGKASTVPNAEKSWSIVKKDDEEGESVFEAYSSNWDTPGFKEFHRRLQVFVLFYIEGAQYIDEEDGRWEFITLFEKKKRGDGFSWHFVGFVSFYSFFCWPDTKRLRLAQFFILPPFQGQGHGASLYSLSYRYILSRSEISELTVEDPSEAFEDMRDKSDLQTLLSGGDLLNITAPFDKNVTEIIRKKYKLADRQFYRLVEMILLLQLNETSPTAIKQFRLTVKRRLYAFNKEMLGQINESERKIKLQEVFQGVETDYRRLTANFV